MRVCLQRYFCKFDESYALWRDAIACAATLDALVSLALSADTGKCRQPPRAMHNPTLISKRARAHTRAAPARFDLEPRVTARWTRASTSQ